MNKLLQISNVYKIISENMYQESYLINNNYNDF